MKTLFVLFLSFTAWVQPIQAVSAFEQTNEIDTQFINYEQFHAISTLPVPEITVRTENVRNPKTTNSGRSGGRDIPKEDTQGNIKKYTPDEVIELIKSYSARYGISPEKPLRIAKCESGYNQFAKNKSSSASGVFQFATSTWATKPLAKDHSVFDADANVHTAIWLMSLGKYWMWECK